MPRADFNASSTDRIFAGVASVLGFCLTATLLNVAAKLASDSVPMGQITAASFVVQYALMQPFALSTTRKIKKLALSLRTARKIDFLAGY